MKAEEGNGFFRIIFLVKLFFLSGFRLLIENEGGEGGCVGRVKAITNDGDRYFSSGDRVGIGQGRGGGRRDSGQEEREEDEDKEDRENVKRRGSV